MITALYPYSTRQLQPRSTEPGAQWTNARRGGSQLDSAFQVERLLNDHEEALGEREKEILSELKTALSLFGPAREHVKTLYFEWALTSLSQLILYAAVPSLAVASIMMVIGEVGTLPGSTLGIENIALVIGACLTITLLPFLLLVSYISRLVTLAKRTLAIEPLILRESQR